MQQSKEVQKRIGIALLRVDVLPGWSKKRYSFTSPFSSAWEEMPASRCPIVATLGRFVR